MRRHRWFWLAGATVLVVGLVLYATVGRYLFTRGTSTPVPLAEVQERYYASTTTTVGADAPAPATVPGAAPLPAPGVYVYSTSGGDRIDALAGDHHDYPTTTTITVTASGCGVALRWDVLAERWERWERCAAAGAVNEPTRTNYDEFFGNGVRADVTCTGDARPLTAAPGTRWLRSCTDDDGATDHRVGTVVATEPRDVAGTVVATLHVTVVVTDDDLRNRQTIESWYLAGSDLIVAQTSTDHSVNPSPVGDVNYDEEYTIELTALAPVTTG